MDQPFIKNNRTVFSFVFFLIFALCIFSVFAVDADNTDGLQKNAAPFLDILYLANLNGNMINCDCGNPSLGGLPQIATIVKRIKSENPNCVFIDGGDFLNTYPYAELNRTVLTIYKIIQPDILCLGDQEFIESDQFDRQLISELVDNLIASNYGLTVSDLTALKLIESGAKQKTKICFLSYLSPKAFIGNRYPDLIEANDVLFQNIYDKYKNDTFLVLNFHGPESSLNQIVDKYPELDLILVAHGQSYMTRTDTRPVVVGGGVDGEMLSRVMVYGNEGNFNIQLNRIQVLKETETDSKIDSIIQASNN